MLKVLRILVNHFCGGSTDSFAVISLNSYLYLPPAQFSFWLSCGTVLTGGMHDYLSLTAAFRWLSFATFNCSWYLLLLANVPLRLFSRFRSKSSGLSFCCYALACEANMAATLQAFCVDYDLWILIGWSCSGDWHPWTPCLWHSGFRWKRDKQSDWWKLI